MRKRIKSDNNASSGGNNDSNGGETEDEGIEVESDYLIEPQDLPQEKESELDTLGMQAVPQGDPIRKTLYHFGIRKIQELATFKEKFLSDYALSGIGGVY